MTYKVTMNGLEINKNFNCFNILTVEPRCFVLISKNIEIDEYVKNIEKYILSDDEEPMGTTIYGKSNDYSKLNKKHVLDVEEIFDDEKLIFSFPDEETAFYFKLKYG